MKTIATHLVLALVLTAFAGASLAQDAAKEPVELTKERAKFQTELETSAKRIRADHIARLKSLQGRFMDAKNLDAALLVRDEIKALESEVKDAAKVDSATDTSFLEGKWIMTEINGTTHELSFNEKGRMNFESWGYPTVSRNGNKISLLSGSKQSLLIKSKNCLVVVVEGKPTAEHFDRVIESPVKADDKPIFNK